MKVETVGAVFIQYSLDPLFENNIGCQSEIAAAAPGQKNRLKVEECRLKGQVADGKFIIVF